MFRNSSVCKKLLAAGLCTAVLLLSMSACQENPEGSIVVHKDMDNLISQAQKNDPDKTDAAKIAEEVKEQFETYQTTIRDEDLGVTVTVNAKVDVPQADKLSVYRVRQKKFDQEFVDKVRKALMGDKPVYEAAALGQWTKADWELSIKTYRDLLRQVEEELAGGEPVTYNGPALTQEEWEAYCRDAIESYQEQIDMMQEQYENAPTEWDLTEYPSEGKLLTMAERSELLPELYSVPPESRAEREALSLAADASDGNYQRLEVENSEDMGNTLYYYAGPECYFAPALTAFQPLDPRAYGEIAPGNGSIPPNFLSGGVAIMDDDVLTPLENDTTTISEEEAIDRAEAFLGEIGLSDFAFDEGGLFNEIAVPSSEMSTEGHTLYYRRYYILRFRREIDGVLLTQASGGKFADSGDGESYRARYWPGEAVEVRVNDAGIVGFAYMAPIEVTETVAENAGLKPFSEVKDTFEKMVCIVSAPEDPNLANLGTDAEIDRVRLSYSRISERDDFESGLVVPVWSFEGTLRYSYMGELDGGISKSLLSINAIDGSIIDGTLGY